MREVTLSVRQYVKVRGKDKYRRRTPDEVKRLFDKAKARMDRKWAAEDQAEAFKQLGLHIIE